MSIRSIMYRMITIRILNIENNWTSSLSFKRSYSGTLQAVRVESKNSTKFIKVLFKRCVYAKNATNTRETVVTTVYCLGSEKRVDTDGVHKIGFLEIELSTQFCLSSRSSKVHKPFFDQCFRLVALKVLNEKLKTKSEILIKWCSTHCVDLKVLGRSNQFDDFDSTVFEVWNLLTAVQSMHRIQTLDAKIF